MKLLILSVAFAAALQAQIYGGGGGGSGSLPPMGGNSGKFLTTDGTVSSWAAAPGLTYPAAGVANSTGTSWGSSYTVGAAANNLVQLNASGQLPAVSGALLTNLPGATYPAAGVANSTGSSWGTSYTVGTAANNLVQLNGSGQLPAVSGALLTNLPSGGGTGNAAANVTTTFSATPTFTCPSATAGTVVNFALSTALTANITSSTLASCTPGSLLNFVFTQDATGNRTVAMPASFDPVTIHPAATVVTKASYFLDAGGAGRLLGAVSTAIYGAGGEVAAPPTPPASTCYIWNDSTNHVPSWKCNNSATVLSAVVPVTRTANQFLTSLSAGGVLGFSAIAAADIPAALANTTSVNGSTIPASATISQTIASGQTAMPTAAVAANTCSASATTATATGAATTDAVETTYAADPTGLTGYGGGTAGGITVRAWPTANTMNFKLCNETAASITPAALNINWRVVR